MAMRRFCQLLNYIHEATAVASKRIAWMLLAACLLFALAAPRTSADVTEPSSKETKQERTQEEYYELFELFVDSMDHIERNYVREVSRRELMEAAIEGMMDKLDPHSSYVAPDEVREFRSSVENKFGGIGIHVTIEGDDLIVVSPLVGAPAYEAGVLAGDRILKIEGKSAKGITLDEVVRQLKGEVGTEVTISVRNGTDGELRKITISRDIVNVETVLGSRRNADDSWNYFIDPKQRIGYVRVNSFSRDTAQQLREVLTDLQKENLQGLVLDLRFNPGGLLTSAIEVCDMFVSQGRIVSTKGRNSQERAWDASKAGTYEGFPMVVLINRYSASASEIVSACLQDHGRAVIVGERSFGKGSVQNVIELEDGKSVLKLTTASYWRPSGKNIHRFPDTAESEEWGVTPEKNNRLRLSNAEIRRLLQQRRDIYIAHGVPKPEPAESDGATPDGGGPDGATPDGGGPAAPDGATPGGNGPATPDSDGDGSEKADPDEPESVPDAPQPAGSKPPAADTGKSDNPDAGNREPAKVAFVDRQLERALNYLSSELAQAATTVSP